MLMHTRVEWLVWDSNYLIDHRGRRPNSKTYNLFTNKPVHRCMGEGIDENSAKMTTKNQSKPEYFIVLLILIQPKSRFEIEFRVIFDYNCERLDNSFCPVKN